MGWFTLVILIICITILCSQYMNLCDKNNIGIFDDEYNSKYILESEKKELEKEIERLKTCK